MTEHEIAVDGAEVADELRRGLRRLTIATVVLFVALVGVVFYVWVVAGRSTNALCEIRHDRERQVAASRDFLVENPNGVPGITAAAVRQSIDNAQRTIDALDGLPCPPLTP